MRTQSPSLHSLSRRDGHTAEVASKLFKVQILCGLDSNHSMLSAAPTTCLGRRGSQRFLGARPSSGQLDPALWPAEAAIQCWLRHGRRFALRAGRQRQQRCAPPHPRAIISHPLCRARTEVFGFGRRRAHCVCSRAGRRPAQRPAHVQSCIRIVGGPHRQLERPAAIGQALCGLGGHGGQAVHLWRFRQWR